MKLIITYKELCNLIYLAKEENAEEKLEELKQRIELKEVPGWATHFAGKNGFDTKYEEIL